MDKGQFLRLSTPQSLISGGSDGHLLVIELNPNLAVPEEEETFEEESERSDSRASEVAPKQNSLERVEKYVIKTVTDKIKFCRLLKQRPFKYRNTLRGERLVVFNFDNAKDYTKASMISNSFSSGMHGSIWYVFKVCMDLVGNDIISDFRIEKPSLDQVYERLIYGNGN